MPVGRRAAGSRGSHEVGKVDEREGEGSGVGVLKARAPPARASAQPKRLFRRPTSRADAAIRSL